MISVASQQKGEFFLVGFLRKPVEEKSTKEDIISLLKRPGTQSWGYLQAVPFFTKLLCSYVYMLKNILQP